MKTTVKFLLILGVIGLVYGCSGKPVKTIENLKYAYNGESTASAKYAAFADKAKAEGFDTVSVMFLATSKAEAIHAENHRKVLEKLGEKIAGPQIGTFEVRSTAENLADAGKGESDEIETMYPGFIAAAKTEKSSDAVKSFTWALDTEKKHKAFYKTALDALNTGGEKSLPAQWFVCPVCGNTYDVSTMAASCDFCMTPKDKFIVF
ncbi:MAG TPA: rubrerythrin [Bacteroidales bacterium]|nr:rubrerythrin [Bacteroidales bacterium]